MSKYLKMNYLVSVIIPTCNRQDLLSRAILSVENQTYSNLEILIIDDCSDIPLDINKLKKLTSKKLRLICNEERKGGAAARNIGINEAEGDFYCFLDDDDVYHADKIEILLDFLLKQECDAVFGKVILRDSDEVFDKFFIPKDINREKNILLMNLIHNNASLISKKCDVLFNEDLTRYQDMQFNLELWHKYNLAYLDYYVADWFVDQRQDKITSSFNIEKKKKDLLAFKTLYIYLRDNLKFSSHDLSPFTLKLIKDSFTCLSLKDFLKTIFNIGLRFDFNGFYKSYIYRRRYFK